MELFGVFLIGLIMGAYGVVLVVNPPSNAALCGLHDPLKCETSPRPSSDNESDIPSPPPPAGPY